MTVALLGPAVVDPLAPGPAGRWRGGGVRVHRRPARHRPHDGVCTPRFCAYRRDGTLAVAHDLTPDELSDDIAVLLNGELGDWLHGRPEFEQVFTGVVRTTVDGGLAAWTRFYRNSTTALERGGAAFAPIHARAAEQIAGHRVLDLGSCFGFFPLRLQHLGFGVLASDVSIPTMDLLHRVSRRMGRPVQTLACDAAEVPLPDGAADTVTALHLLEHLDRATGERVVDEALRLARRRVVIAVPFEDRPQACYGHIRRFDAAELARLGDVLCARHPGICATVSEHHGGWLVLSRG